MNNDNYVDVNRDAWDKRTKVHVNSPFYDLEGFKKGETALVKVVRDELTDIKGKSLLHLQCHFGLDTLSFARMGAEVTGVDLSPVSVETATKLAAELDIPGKFVESNVLELDQKMDEKFDIVFTSFGAICWLNDIDEWARQVSLRLKPGGTFYMAEFHPFIYMIEWEDYEIKYGYFDNGEPIYEEVKGTYAESENEDKIEYECYTWPHSLGSIFTALGKCGILVEQFHEFDYTPYNCFENLIERSKGEWIYKLNGQIIPAMFSMKGKMK